MRLEENRIDAQHHFTAALASFTRLKSDLASLPDALTSIPIYGTRLCTGVYALSQCLAYTGWMGTK